MANSVHKNFKKYGALYQLQLCCNPLCNVKNVYSNNTFNTIDQLWKIPMHSRIFHTDHDYRSKYYEYVSYNSFISAINDLIWYYVQCGRILKAYSNAVAVLVVVVIVECLVRCVH